MLDLRLYMAQRLSALLMVPFIIVHIAVMIYAVQGGLTASEILGRTQDSMLWFLFYGIFVIAVSIHAAIGLRVVLHEWLGLQATALNIASWVIGVGLLTLGGRAVLAVTFL